MSLFDGRTPASNAPQTPKCAICGDTSIGITWGFELCATHSADWFDDKRFNADVVDSAAGCLPTEGWRESNAKSSAEYARRTKVWVSERKLQQRKAS